MPAEGQKTSFSPVLTFFNSPDSGDHVLFLEVK